MQILQCQHRRNMLKIYKKNAVFQTVSYKDNVLVKMKNH